MVVVSLLSLILVVFRIFVQVFWWGLGLGFMTLIAYGSLTGYGFLRPLWRVAHPALLLLHLLLPLQLLLLSGIVVLDTSPVQGSPPLLVVVL